MNRSLLKFVKRNELTKEFVCELGFVDELYKIVIWKLHGKEVS